MIEEDSAFPSVQVVRGQTPKRPWQVIVSGAWGGWVVYASYKTEAAARKKADEFNAPLEEIPR